MSNQHNEAILERLYDEAYEELRPLFDQKEYGDMAYRYEDLHLAAVDLAKKRMETADELLAL